MKDSWKEDYIENIFNVSSGSGLSEANFKPGFFPVYGGNGIVGYHNDFTNIKTALIIGRVGAQCGNIYLTERKSWITDNALIISFIQNDASYDFWFYLLTHFHLRDFAFQSAQPVITGGILKRIKICIPPLPQQQKIAKILSTCDAVIEKTEAAIAKYQAIKQGMMHDLFTRGIDLNSGQLRPSYKDAPELYKESELGMIPLEWEVKELSFLITEGILDNIQDGNHGELHPKSNDFIAEGIPFVMASDISNGYIDLRNCSRISEKQYKSLRIGFSKSGDILLSHKASIGFVAQVPESLDRIMLTPQVTYYRVLKRDILDDQFLKFYLQSDTFQVPLLNLAKQSTRDYIGITMQKELCILLLSNLSEQLAISEKLNSAANKIEIEQSTLTKYKKLKTGLMQDLLTGKVPVKA